MTKLCFFLLFFCALQTKAQNRYSVGFIGAPAYYTIKSVKNNSSWGFSNDIGYTLGIDGHYYFNNSKLSVGLLYNTLVYESTFIPITNTNVLDPNIPLFTSYDTKYLNIPVYYSLSLININSFNISASVGVKQGLLIHSKEYTIYEDLSQRPSDFSRRLIFSGLVGLNLNYEIKQTLMLKANFVFEKVVKRYSPYMADPSEFRPYIGIEYLF